MKMTRRTFVIHSLTSSMLVATSNIVLAQAAKVSEADPQAVALGYKENASKVDKTKFPKYVVGQACSNCQLYQGPATGVGACPLFSGKTVAGSGWCTAYAKKA